jgi:hypothetical protein
MQRVDGRKVDAQYLEICPSAFVLIPSGGGMNTWF